MQAESIMLYPYVLVPDPRSVSKSRAEKVELKSYWVTHRRGRPFATTVSSGHVTSASCPYSWMTTDAQLTLLHKGSERPFALRRKSAYHCSHFGSDQQVPKDWQWQFDVLLCAVVRMARSKGQEELRQLAASIRRAADYYTNASASTSDEARYFKHSRVKVNITWLGVLKHHLVIYSHVFIYTVSYTRIVCSLYHIKQSCELLKTWLLCMLRVSAGTAARKVYLNKQDEALWMLLLQFMRSWRKIRRCSLIVWTRWNSADYFVC